MSEGEPVASNILTATATARPKRVAILVDRDALTLDELDILTQQCATYWGGGFWPIVPTNGSEITDDWWSVLQAVDADVIVAACTVSQPLCERIHRHLAPADLVPVDRRGEAGGNTQLTWPLDDLGALSAHPIAEYHAQMRAYPPPTHFLYLVDSARPAPDPAFVLRNFGLVRATVGTDLGFRNVPHDRIAVDETSKADLLNRFIASVGQLVVPRDLSQLYAPRSFDLQYDRPAQAFHVIIGDTLDEALFAWNRPLTSDGHAGRDFLWLDAASARDPEIVRLVAEWIRRVFWNNQQQRGGRILSYSEDVELLRDVGETIRTVAWLPCESVRLERGQFPFHSRPAFRRLQYQSAFEEGPRRTEQVPMAEHQGLLGVPRPPFLNSTSGPGGWMLDLDLEYRLDPHRYTNQPDSWRLPRRARLGYLFSSGRRQARVIVGGLPSVSVTPGERSFPLREPSKGALLARLLDAGPQCDTSNPTVAVPAGRFQDVRTSEQGRRFRGLIDLFGSVGAAGRMFDDLFWRTVFLEAAGKPLDDIERRTQIVRRELERTTGVGQVAAPAAAATRGDLDTSPVDLESVARKIVRSLHRVEPQVPTFTRKELRDLFGRLRGGETIATDKGERRLRFEDFAALELESLLAAGVLLQGVMLTCRACGIPQWRRVDDLSTAVRCDGCTTQFPLPPEPPWRFRLNALVQTALARDGVLPLLHAVHDLTERAREMVLVIAPQELREVYDGPVTTDLDLVIVQDGTFIIGEVKSHPAAFDEKVIGTLADVALSIRPDHVVLAAAGTQWPEDVRQRIDRLRETMAAVDIEVVARLLDW